VSISGTWRSTSAVNSGSCLIWASSAGLNEREFGARTIEQAQLGRHIATNAPNLLMW
jgi:hypothetical protein